MNRKFRNISPSLKQSYQHKFRFNLRLKNTNFLQKTLPPQQEQAKEVTNFRRTNSKSYKDLLPELFRDGVRVILPILEVRSPKKVIKLFEREFMLNVSKPDRMRKDHSYAMLCVMLSHFGYDSVGARILKEYAQEGLGIVGCRRRSEVSKASVFRCGRTSNCKVIFRPLCRLFIPILDTCVGVGDGRVNVLQRDIAGKEIAEVFVFAHIGQVDQGAIDTARETAQRVGVDVSRLTNKISDISAGCVIECPLSGVSRITLVSDITREEIASGIIVDDRVPSDSKEDVPSRKRMRSDDSEAGIAEENGTGEEDVGSYVIVCDLRVTHKETEGRVPYRYREFYGFKQFKFLKWARSHREVTDVIELMSLN